MAEPRTKLPWTKETFVDNRPAGTDHHTYKITPQRGVYGSLFEEDADYIVEAVNSHATLVSENLRYREALKTISEMAPATQEMTLAHQMSDVADAALSKEESQ